MYKHLELFTFEKTFVDNFSSTSMQNMRSTGRSRIKIQGVEMG